MNFTPDSPSGAQIDVPFFEDARADIAPGYAAERDIAKLRSEMLTSLVHLGASDIIVESGKFAYAKPGVTGKVRYGFLVRFRAYGQPAQMQIAGLPMRQTDTEVKREKVMRQALFVACLQLKAMITLSIFSPGSAPLIQYVLLPGTQHTVAEYVVTAGGIPNMNPQLSERAQS